MTASSDAGEPKFEINALYKIFGSEPEVALKALRDGNLTKSELLEQYNHVLALEDINFNAKAGEISVIMGLSGSGKSTLIRHINRLIEPTSGEIIYGGSDILHCSPDEYGRYAGKNVDGIPEFWPLPHRTVIQNVGLSLEARGSFTKRIFSEAEKWLHEVGLQGYEGKYRISCLEECSNASE